MENKKVLLGMSGGVDSSVSAILLKNAGFNVIGVTMKLWEGKEDEESKCCNLDSTLDAKRVCDKINIPHYTLNFQEEFQEKVINNFICEYKNCRTPNPCIECNKYLKFGKMYIKAKELEAEYIATGHYAKIEYSEKYGRYILRKAKNLAKDQSYVLYGIPKDLLKNIILPLGDFKSKDEIRKIAKQNDLIVANKPDSEDICFIPDGDYKKFLEENSTIKSKPGNIITTQGKILGKHSGLYKYTIGQRRGIGISNEYRLYVIGFNIERNELIVGEEKELYKKEMYVNNINLLLVDDIQEPMRASVKTRYSQKEALATIVKIDADTIKVVFDEPQPRITSGQSAVFYQDDIVIGGGIIK